MKVYDISQEVFSGVVYPGDDLPSAFPISRMSEGAICNITNINMCVHNATHIDAPFHFIDDGKSVDLLPVEIFIGNTLVVNSASDFISAEEMKEFLKTKPKRLIIKGGAYLSDDAAFMAVEHGLRLIGTELQSIEAPDSLSFVHKILLSAGIPILEGLALDKIKAGNYFLSALPLKLGGLDGSPCRAVLISEKD